MIIPNGLNKRHLIGNWLSPLEVDLAIKSGLLQLRSSQPHLAACQAYHTSDHVRTALGNSRCNLAAGEAVARRINTALVAPRVRKLEIPHAGNWRCARGRRVRYRTSYLEISMGVLSPLSLKYVRDPAKMIEKTFPSELAQLWAL